MNIVFFGTSSFAGEILLVLLKKQFSVVAVVTRPDRPKGRNRKLGYPAVKETVLHHAPKLPLFQPERASTPEFALVLEAFSPDLFVVAAYGEIMKQFLLDIPRIECINVHASLLPKYRGAAPIQRCLMAGEKETGITIIAMTAQMDAGEMLAQEKYLISEEINAGELEQQLSQMGAQLVCDVIMQLREGTEMRIPQEISGISYASKIQSEEERIDWRCPSETVHNHIRALAPQPGAWTFISIDGTTKRLKILRTHIHAQKHKAQPGETIFCDRKTWIVACGEGALELCEVQLEGKKKMAVREFILGTREHFALH